MKLLHQLLEANAAAAPATPYLHFQGRTYSYLEVMETSQRLARALAGTGIQRGDRVAMMLGNRPEIVFGYFACWKLGVIAVPLNTRYRQREAAYALEHADAVALICESRYFPIMEPLCRKDHLHEHTVLVDGKANGLTEFPDWDDFLAAAPKSVDWPELAPDAPANMNYTSGSTAMPKGVLHSHQSLYEMARLLVNVWDHPDLKTAIGFLPLCYIGGNLFQLLNCLHTRRDFVIIRDKSQEDFLSAIEDYQATDTFLLSSDLVLLMEHPRVREMDWSSLRVILSGGDKVPVDTQKEFHRVTGLEVTEGYGMTEIGMSLINPVYGSKHYGTMGRALPEVGVELRDSRGRVLGDGAVDKPGRLWVKTSACMLGYWNNPHATAATIKNGWLDTGDLATCDADGFYTFAGRSKLIIIHGGSNISPQEVEEVIDHHPAVQSCCVVGKADPKWGETVMAFVVPHGFPSQAPAEADIIRYAQQRLAHYKCPERVAFLETMPVTATGKMDRQGLKARAAEG